MLKQFLAISFCRRESISGTERVILKLNLLTAFIVKTNLTALFQFRLYVLLLPLSKVFYTGKGKWAGPVCSSECGFEFRRGH